ncbi:unnamed protein product [Ambrosiozyma monospora]|uniref:Unnamed protein product n=1 Tax=Ambrosiozyma monospora TaxID=43982 RepID=A0ACB5T632_AMBMO|nr:unnamed protein product [Ambrosiozyma monospora]
MEKIMNKYTNQTIGTSFLQMAVMLPMNLRKPIVAADGTITYDKSDTRHYLPILFSCWTTQRSNKEISCVLVVILNIAEAVLKKMAKNPEIAIMGKYGIFTQDQFNLLINQLLMTSKITHKDDKQSKYVKLIIQLIVCSMTSEHALDKFGIMDMLQTYANAVQTLVHPSNNGGWSTILSQAIKTLALTYHERLMDESKDRNLVSSISDDYSTLPENVKLNDKVTAEFIKMMKPLIHLGIQAKSNSYRKRYIKALETLCFIHPKLILDDVLLDIYSSFESVNSTHRINVVLRELIVLVRFMANNSVYRVHIPRLLSMLLPGIDSNDAEKTILTMQFVKSVSAVVPVVDLAEGLGDGGLLAVDFTQQHLSYLEALFYKSSPNENVSIYGNDVPDHFEYDPEFELEALKSASSSFPEFIRNFCQNCFKYLEYSPSVEGDEGIESRASMLMSQVFDSLIESVSDELFEIIANEFYTYITENVKHLVAIIFTNIAELIVRRDPKKQFPKLYNYLFPQVKLEIEQGAGTSRTQEILSKDARLIWHYKLLCGTVLGGGEEIIPYIPEIQTLIVTSFPKLRGEATFTTGMLLNAMLSTLTLTRMMERRLISPDWLAKNGGKVTAACWGGFQFDPYRFDPDNLKFDWRRFLWNIPICWDSILLSWIIC